MDHVIKNLGWLELMKKAPDPIGCQVSWGSKVVPRSSWIDPGKKYTCNGCRVINLSIQMTNSCGEGVTYPVKGTVVLREKPFLTDYCIWSLDGLDNVVWPDSHHNLVQEPAWCDRFLTLENGEWLAWDESQSVVLGRFKKRGWAIDKLLEHAKELDAEYKDQV